jgi:CRISPR/Cas system-associated exonuclease Cas4 (RecB family)
MVALPAFASDETLDAIDKAIEAAQEIRPQNGRLYFSQIGRDCEREIFYFVNDYPREPFKAKTLKMFECGNIAEELMAKRLHMLPQIELYTVAEDGKQFKFSDFDDRFSGRIDGAIRGLLEAPKKFHAWEHKSSGKIAALIKAKEVYGPKKALEVWNYSYYATAVLYMHYGEFERHYLTVSTPGGREYTSTRTEPNPVLVKHLIGKAKRILDAKSPPARISEQKSFYKCKNCDFRESCWQEQNVYI